MVMVVHGMVAWPAASTPRLILADFFKHAFDGSGADNFFDAGLAFGIGACLGPTIDTLNLGA